MRSFGRVYVVMALLAVAVACVVFAAPDAVLASGGGEGGEAHQGKSLWELFKTTGWVGILLVLLSIGGMALTIDYGIHMREDQLAPPHLVAEVQGFIENGEFEEAANVAAADPSYFGRVVGAGLAHVHAGSEEAIGSLETMAAEELFKLNAKISYLSLVGNVAPLLGLLGTVTGMISSFQVIEKLKAPTPKDLAVGVYESLVNTTMGLFIAIVFLVAFFIFKNKITRITLAVNTMGHDLVKRSVQA